MPLSSEEIIVRAICTDKMNDGAISPSLFNGRNTSVSRLAILPLADHWDIFRHHVQKPPERLLEMIGEIQIAHLQKIGMDHPERPTQLTVEPKPEDWNRAHAEIPENITRGLATKIVKALTLHKDEG